MASKKIRRTREKSYNDKSIRSIDKNLDNSKVFDTKRITAKHSRDDSLEKTNVQEFHFNDSMLDDVESLDTSFLEGSKRKKERVIKEEYEKPIIYKDVKVKKKKHRAKKSIYIILIIIISIFIGGFLSYLLFDNDCNQTKVVKKEVKDRVIRDENLVFLGDSLFYFYDLDEYFPKNKVVNSGINGNTTTDILDSMYNRVYRYNPSKVFLLIGTNNLQKDVSMEDTFSEMEEIIKGIKDNRKMANVYVISLLPINDNEDEKKIDMKVVGKRTNEDIKKINKEYKKICEENKVAFIDIFNKFTDDDGRMNIDYTKEGLHLSDEGYELLTECLKKYIDK